MLQAVTLNYNAFVKFTFTLPAGKTLANYALQIDAFFPYATMGLTTSENYYKDLMLFAGTSITGTPDSSNADFQSTRVSTPAWNEVDAWKTLTLNFDSTKAALLSGTVEVAVGINRPAATTADAYYLDNVQLVEIP